MGNQEHVGQDGAGQPIEQPAVRTTIVGGRPPGSGQAVGPIPRGIEVLVKKAAVDPAFKALLLSRRAEAAAVIGLALTPAEATMLTAVPADQLAAIIARTRVDAKVVPAFLGKAAVVMLAALGAATFEAGCKSRGIAPDDPRQYGTTAPSDPANLSRPDRTPGSWGVQPDRPPTARPDKPN